MEAFAHHCATNLSECSTLWCLRSPLEDGSLLVCERARVLTERSWRFSFLSYNISLPRDCRCDVGGLLGVKPSADGFSVKPSADGFSAM